MFQSLQEDLLYLKDHHNLVAIKAGTEVEAMNFDEIHEMRAVSLHIVPMTTKIGGPEARNDMTFMISHGIDMILAPMIESDYGLKNFINAARQLDSGETLLAVNIETITAYNNLDSMMKLPEFNYLHQITVGRSDLSASMGKEVNDREVLAVTSDIIRRVRARGIRTSVGGKVTPLNAGTVKKEINPDSVNTRHMVIGCSSRQIAIDITAALEWEMKFYRFLYDKYPQRRSFYEERIVSIEQRNTCPLIA